MLQELSCPACRKALRLDVSEGGQWIICPACGTWIQSPLAQPNTAFVAPDDPPAIAVTDIAPRTFARPRTRPALGHPTYARWAMLAAVVLCLAGLIGTAVVSTSQRPVSSGSTFTKEDEAFYARLLALKSQAEELVIAGKLPEAHAKYRELRQVLGTHIVKGDVFDLMERAKYDQDQIYAILVKRAAGEYAGLRTASQPAATAPSAEAVVATQPYPRDDQALAVPPVATGTPATQQTAPVMAMATAITATTQAALPAPPRSISPPRPRPPCVRLR